MQLPTSMPTRPLRSDQPIYVSPISHGKIAPQGDPAHCALCCIPKAGYGACVARCIATGQACDGGLSNCTSC